MSYAPDDQLLGPSIEKMLEGIAEFCAAAGQRIQHPEEWRFEHLVELNELRGTLQDIQFKLAVLGGSVR